MGAEARKQYTAEFKREAVGLVTEQGYTLVGAARNLGINRDMLRRWKREGVRDGAGAFPGKGAQTLDQAELSRLRAENRRLQMEREIVKKATLSSTGQCNTIRTNIDMEGVGYGTIRASRTFDYPKRGCVATVEKRTILERYWSSPWQACGVDTPGRLFQWRDYFAPPTAFVPRPDAG